jgi:eukaryotic-like serine/threonine-protein kinase
MLQAGDKVGERYEAIEQIAEGGMGTLWRARHTELGVEVALKLIAPRAVNASSLKRFKREAQAAARLRGPNVVQVFDFGVYQGQPYLAMELLRGEDLAALIKREGRLSLERCSKIVAGVAKGLELAHGAGIVHRDLKPANIFLERVGDDEVVKILDFGVAKDLHSEGDAGSTSQGGAVGSPSYMSPEQVWAEAIDHRTDVWAMGVVTFEMLTGENPFADETLAKVFERIVRHPLPVASQLDSRLTPAVDLFFEHALARSPTERITSAREFAEEFELALAGAQDSKSARAKSARTQTRFATTRPPSAPAVEPRRFRPGLGLWLGIGSGVLVVTTAGVLLSGGGSPESATNAPEPREAPAPMPTAVDVLPSPALPVSAGSSSSAVAPAALPRSTASVRPTNPRRVAPVPSAPPVAADSAAPALDPRFGIPLNR